MKKIILFALIFIASYLHCQTGVNNSVPLSRVLTINGVSQNLSANRSWTIATPSTTNLWSITGNTLGAGTGSIGTTDNFPFSLITNSITKVTFSTSASFSVPIVLSGTNNMSAENYSLSGVNATRGYFDFTHTGIAVTGSPSATGFRLHGSSGNLNWVSTIDNKGRAFTGTVTTNRTYQLPDASGTVALTSDLSAYQTTVSGGFIPYTSPNSFTSTNAITAASLISTGGGTFTGAVISPTFYGSSASGGNAYFMSTSDATKGSVTIGASTGSMVVPPVAIFNKTAYFTGTNTAISIGDMNTQNDRYRLFVGNGTGGFNNGEAYTRLANTNWHILGGGSGLTEVMNIASGTVGITGSVSVSGTSALTGNVLTSGSVTVNGDVLSGMATILMTTTVSNGEASCRFKSGTSEWRIGNQIAANQQNFEINLQVGGTAGTKLLIDRTTGNTSLNNGITLPTGKLHIGAGTIAASTSPLKFSVSTSTLLSTPETGAVETESVTGKIYYTPVSTRYQIATCLTNTATLDFPSTAAGAVSDLTLTVTGAVDGDAVDLGVQNTCIAASGVYYGWVSSTNVVTIRFANNNLITAFDPNSGVFKAVVFKN